MMEENRNRTGLIRAIVVLTLCIISCTIFLVNHKQEVKLSTKENNNNTSEILDPTDINAIEDYSSNRQEITKASVNDMLRSVSGVFSDVDNIKTINITSVKLTGSLSSNPSEKLGTISGTFTCLDNSKECFYSDEIFEKGNNTYGFNMYAIFTKNAEGNYYISELNNSSMMEDPSFVKKEIVIE